MRKPPIAFIFGILISLAFILQSCSLPWMVQGNGQNNNDPSILYDWCGGRNGGGQPSPCLKN